MATGNTPSYLGRISQAFLQRFLPESIQIAREREFEQLTQDPYMIVYEYNAAFIRLARYAPHLVPNKRRRIRRFILGLCQPYY